MEDGRLVVWPAPLTPYPIDGRVESQAHTSCLPGGDRCATTKVYRFSVKCRGVSVPWMRLAAVIPPRQGGRRWIERGRMKIVRPAGGQNGVREVMERIELPAGFAPMAETGATIEGAAGAEIPAKPATVAGENKVAPGTSPAQALPAKSIAAPVAPSVSLAPPAVVAAPASAPAAAGAAPAASQSSAARPPKADAKSQWVAVLEAKDLSDQPDAVEEARPYAWGWLGALFALGLVAFGISRVPPDRRGAIKQDLARGALAAVSFMERERDRLKALGADLAARASRSRAKTASFTDAAAGEEARVDDPQLVNAAWAAATLLDQIEQAVKGLGAGTPLRAVLEDELSVIQRRLVDTRASALEGHTPEKSAAQFRALIRELERVKRIASSAAASLSGTRAVITMPRSRNEAYQLLGVNADVSEGILKKLVDALRMTWHPDHARDEEDRQLREDRIKQINVAWELCRSE